MKYNLLVQFGRGLGVSAALRLSAPVLLGRENVLKSANTPHVPEIWDDSNKLPVGLEIALAVLWICIFCSIPFMLRAFEANSNRKRTVTQTMITGVFLFAVIGGLLLFTNVIKFNSYHFEGARTLTIIECVYLMSQVVTTVGYGDITPAFPRGQVFVGLYVICSILVIAMMVSELVAHVTDAAHNYQVKLAAARAQNVEQSSPPGTARRHSVAAANFVAVAEYPSKTPLMIAFGCFSFFAITWALFFHLYPGEGKTPMQAIYMSVITLSTVGLGAFTPSTPAGQAFAAFWMMFGSSALVAVVTKFTELMIKIEEYERHDPADAKRHMHEFREQHAQEKKTDEISELDLIKFVLKARGLVSEGDLALFESSFKELASGEKDGMPVVSLSKLQNLLEGPKEA